MIEWMLITLVPISTQIQMSTDSHPPSPNIIFIVSDDAGYSDFGFQGSDDIETPNLDALCASGVRFEQAYVTASVCSPSRAGLITGRYQQRIGYEHNIPVGGPHGLPGDTITIADRLQQARYTTSAIGKWHLGYEPEMRPLEQGFDRFHGLLAGSRHYKPYDNDAKRGNYRVRVGDEVVADEPATFAWFTDYLGEIASEQILELAPSEPYFMYLCFTAPHTPMQASPEDLAAVGGEPSKRKTYRAMQRALDRAIGEVVSAVDASGEADNTIIWFVNDNGGATNNGSDNGLLRGMKGSKFEGGVRVPMLLRWPGVTKPGQFYLPAVSTLDMTATVLGAANANTSDIDGVDLRPFLVGEDQSKPHEFLYWRRGPVASVLQNGRWKLIRVEEDQYMLFDIRGDVTERIDLAPLYAARVARMRKAMEAWESEMQQPASASGERWRSNQIKKHQAEVDSRAKERSLP